VKSRVWWLVGINTVVLLMVLLLSYSAGARSGGLSLLDFGALPQVAGFQFLAALFLVMAISIVLLLQLGIKVVKPTRQLVEFSEKLIAGDYEAHADVTEDDYGVIAENWNRAAEIVAQSAAIKAADETVRFELAEMEHAVTQLARGDLSARAQASQLVLTPVVDAFNTLAENYARRMERLRTTSADIAVNASQVQTAAIEMANGATQQEQSMLNAAAAIAQLSTSTQQVSEHALAASEAARNALGLSDQGMRAVRDTSEGMQRIRSVMQATAAKIKSLGDRSLEIYEIINVIHETNLLALNAVLEFSRGGQAGQNQLMSSEMRKLADHSRTSTRDIVTLLKSIQAESNEAVSVIEQGNRVAENGARLTEQANQAFAGIAEVLQHTSEFSEAISLASRDQLQGTERVAGAVQEIAANMRQNSNRGRQSAKIVEQVVRSSEQLTQAATQARPAAGPVVVKPEKAETASSAVVGRA
jgi:twitching motility protein PilJ